jgi:flagellar secretion chaperone FliS
MSQLTSRAHAAYKADGVTTASPGRLIVMLYDRLLIDLDRAEAALNSHQSSHEHLLHAQDIVLELRVSLDIAVWDGAAGLAGIYTFVYQELVLANVKRDVVRIGVCRQLLKPLRDAWAQILESPHASAGATVGSPLEIGLTA